MDFAHSLIQFKAIDGEQRVLEGIATTPTPDRIGDVMDPTGATFALPLPLLWQHDKHKPIGHVIDARVTPAGIAIRAQIAKGIPFIDEAWQLLKAGLVRGLSIGWRPLAAPELVAGKSDRTVRYKKWEWLELSTVTVAMNAETTILSVKSADTAQRDALSGPPARKTSAVAGSAREPKMNYSEQIAAEKAELQSKSTRLEELEQQDSTDGGLGAEETTERDTLTKGIDALVAKIARLSTLESAQAMNAKTVSVPAPARLSNGYATASRIEVVKKQLPPATAFVRYVKAMAVGRGSTVEALHFAKQWDHETPEVSAYIKAIAGTALVGSPAWGGELAYAQNLASEFMELLRDATILGRINNLRNVPFNVRFTEQTSGSTVNWVGEGAVKPVGELAFAEHTLTWSKVAGIVVITEELARLSTPSAEEAVRRDLVEAISKFIDVQFVTPGVTATANNPASITNGASTSAASGTTAAALRDDLNTALASFSAANISTGTLHIITTEAVARGIALQVNALGQPEFATATPAGGTLFGYPVIASNSVPSGLVIFLVANEVLLADDGRVTIDASREATLDMAGGSSPVYNLWQRNAIGIRAERWIRWQRRREDAVYYLTGAAYAP